MTWKALTKKLPDARELCVPQETSEAIVLRGVDFSETSRIVTFLSPARGRLACMARGVKRPKNQLAAMLDTFNRLEVTYYWKDGRSIQPLSEAVLLDGFDAIKRDLEKSAFAAFPMEVAGKTAHENEPSQSLYDTLVHGLRSLSDWTGDVRTHACWQVLQLLSEAGFEPRLDVCADCGAPAGLTPGFAYRGGVTCSQCSSDRRLTTGGLEALRAMQGSRECCPDAPGDEAYEVVWRYAAHQLMTEFQSARVIHQLFDSRANGRT
ncbi:MAG: DNA repair protein RecO [Candidatus Hydrogenedentes bacterium]|nr:DNA repair protein RecO [Candidatus Hydrogenedentota bacterium]